MINEVTAQRCETRRTAPYFPEAEYHEHPVVCVRTQDIGEAVPVEIDRQQLVDPDIEPARPAAMLQVFLAIRAA